MNPAATRQAIQQRIGFLQRARDAAERDAREAQRAALRARLGMYGFAAALAAGAVLTLGAHLGG